MTAYNFKIRDISKYQQYERALGKIFESSGGWSDKGFV